MRPPPRSTTPRSPPSTARSASCLAPLPSACSLIPPARSVRASLFPSSGACAAAATILLVAHQTAAVARGDRVLVMEAGRGVQDGTPQALLADETGAYARLVKQDARRLV